MLGLKLNHVSKRGPWCHQWLMHQFALMPITYINAYDSFRYIFHFILLHCIVLYTCQNELMMKVVIKFDSSMALSHLYSCCISILACVWGRGLMVLTNKIFNCLEATRTTGVTTPPLISLITCVLINDKISTWRCPCDFFFKNLNHITK